jgi:hypothetical protein
VTTADEVAQIVGQLLQGQVLELPALPILSTRSGPLHPAAQAIVSENSVASAHGLAPILVPVAVASGRVMVVSQTCDLQARKTSSGRVLAHVAPLVSLTARAQEDASKDSRPNLIPVPWAGDQFADLDQMAAVDRGLLARATVGPAPPENERRSLAYRLGRYFARAALPDEVVQALQPLQRVADPRHEALRRVLDAVLQIRVFSEPPYDGEGPYDLCVVLIVDAEWYPDAPPGKFRDTGKELHSTASAMAEVYDSADDPSGGALVVLWQRFAGQLGERLESGLETRSEGAVKSVSFTVDTALTPGQFDDSDALDFGHLSLTSEE